MGIVLFLDAAIYFKTISISTLEEKTDNVTDICYFVILNILVTNVVVFFFEFFLNTFKDFSCLC